MNKFGRLALSVLIIAQPWVVLLLNLVGWNIPAVCALLVGFLYGRDFSTDWARLIERYREFRNLFSKEDDVSDDS